MDRSIQFSSSYLIRTECGQEFDLFSAKLFSVKDPTFVDHTLYLTRDHTYLYSSCNVFRDFSSPETYQVIDRDAAERIFLPYLSEQQRKEYFS
jgi:hypothetical protein